jgi:hypothetical protein
LEAGGVAEAAFEVEVAVALIIRQWDQVLVVDVGWLLDFVFHAFGCGEVVLARAEVE